MGKPLTLHLGNDKNGVIQESGKPLLRVLTWGEPATTIEMEQIADSEWNFKFSDLVKVTSSISAFKYDKFTVQDDPPTLQSKGYIGLFMKRAKSGTITCFIQHPDCATEVEFNIPSHPSVDSDEMLHRAKVILQRHNLSLIKLSEERTDPAWVVKSSWVTEEPISHAISAAANLCSAAHAIRWPESFSPRDVIDILRQDLASLLMGRLTEGGDFDAKEFVDLSSTAGKVEFAKDVAQFANSPTGGLLLIGAKTAKRDGGAEYLRKVSALDKNPRLSGSVPTFTQRLRDIADRHIYPPISELEIEHVQLEAGEVVYAYIPPQNPQDMPFFVTGEAISEKYFGEFYSIPRRRRDGNLPVTVREIHRFISGRLWP